MKTLTTPVSNSAAAAESGWCELYDFYLPNNITTPWGTTNVLRLCTLPGGISFFTPDDLPEPAGTQGDAQNYVFWPLKREVVKGNTKFQDDRLQITASNVTVDWARMLAAVNWYDIPVVIRKLPLNQTGLTASDCAVIFSGWVDFPKVDVNTVQLACSGALGPLSTLLPIENMHAMCRFRFADDMCTALPFSTDNYKAGTCGSGSTVGNVKSSDFTQDTGSSSGYGTDLVDALADTAITASSQVTGGSVNNAATTYFTPNNVYGSIDIPGAILPVGAMVVFADAGSGMPQYSFDYHYNLPHYTVVAGQVYYIVSYHPEWNYGHYQVSTSAGGPVMYWLGQQPIYASQVLTSSAVYPVTADHTTNTFSIGTNAFSNGTAIFFSGTSMPGGLKAGYAYYVINWTSSSFQISLTKGGSVLTFSSNGSGISAQALLINAGAPSVKASAGGGWSFSNSADWGNNDQGYWQIPDAQAGLQNGALKPWIEFDFGSAVTPKLWQVSSFLGVQQEQRVRLIEFFSSTNNSTWNFECYFQMPNTGGQLFDVLIPKASTARYWRICVRSRWAETLYFLLFHQVSAYAGSRNWWMDGQITFDGNVTAALAGVSRYVLSSFSGEIFCSSLPVAPASGDTFTIKRGCGRSFNACAARLNTENYGGFDDLGLQNVVNFTPQ